MFERYDRVVVKDGVWEGASGHVRQYDPVTRRYLVRLDSGGEVEFIAMQLGWEQ